MPNQKIETSEIEKDTIGDSQEYVQYAIEIERTLHELQKDLSNTLDPKQAAMGVLRVATNFYDADWCGILDVDSEVGVWAPVWWYNREHGEMARSSFNEFELLEGYGRWLDCLQNHEPVIIQDIEAIKDEYPVEYSLYKRLEAKSILAVPFWKGPKGFLTLKNPKRYADNISMLRILNFAVVSLINEYHLLESRKLTIMSPRITSEDDVYISIFGEMVITTKEGILTETELKSPKIARLLVYLLLSRKVACSPREIVDALWADEDVDSAVKNIKGLIYRLQQAFGHISNHRLITSTTNGYQLNPKLHITTDYQLFDKKWNVAVKALDIEEKIKYLKKAVDLYQGPMFRSAKHEHWIMATSVSFEMRYLGAVSELMKALFQINDYLGIQQYAAKAVQLCPHSVDVYFWMIVSMYKLNNPEMAKGELRMARCNLLSEEYEELTNRLNEQVQLLLAP